MARAPMFPRCKVPDAKAATAMRRPSVLTFFALSALGWTVVLTLLWTQVSAWTSCPVATLSHFALEHGAPMWVRTVHKSPGTMEVESSIAMPMPSAGGRLAEATVEAVPARYAYGLPIFMALLLAARGPGRLVRALVGYLLLLPVQAFSLSFYLLMQLVLFAQANARVLKVSQWQVEAIVYGYQMGALVLPTLAPILLWLWLDRQFVERVLVRAWRGSADAAAVVSPTPAAAPRRAVPRVGHAPDRTVAPAQVPVPVAVPPTGPPKAAEISSSTVAVLPPR